MPYLIIGAGLFLGEKLFLELHETRKIKNKIKK